jgi:O-antigen ligase
MGFNYGTAGLLNAHNQYFETLLDIGYLGLIGLLALIAIGFRKGLKSNNLLAFFMLVITFAFLTESYLEAQKGIVFITLFWTVLGSLPKPGGPASAA